MAWQCPEKARAANSMEEEARDPLAMCMMHEATVSHELESESISHGNSSATLGVIKPSNSNVSGNPRQTAIINYAAHERPALSEATRPRAPKFCATFGSQTCCSECEDLKSTSLDAFRAGRWTTLSEQKVVEIVREDEGVNFLESENPVINSLDSPEYTPFMWCWIQELQTML